MLADAAAHTCACSYQQLPTCCYAVSNFGSDRWGPTTKALLEALVKRGLVDELVCYTPTTFTTAEKKRLVSDRATGADLGAQLHGGRLRWGSCSDRSVPPYVAGVSDVSLIGDQFFNELMKRERGRLKCLGAKCTYFMSMDCDEFYDSVCSYCWCWCIVTKSRRVWNQNNIRACVFQDKLTTCLAVMEDRGYECGLCLYVAKANTLHCTVR